MGLTGTPVENHLGELWSLFRVLFPALLGTLEQFRERFAGPIERGGEPRHREALSRVMRPFLLRRKKSEVARELPARTDIPVLVSLSPREQERYEDARLSSVAALSGIDLESDRNTGRFEVLAALTRLRQLACHVKLVDEDWSAGSSKLDHLIELIQGLRESGHRALVFSQFTRYLKLAKAALEAKGLSVLYLDGETPAAARGEIVEQFQAGTADAFLLSLKAGGTGLNLTAADYVIHLDPWWNPAAEDQATDRAHRIGQMRPVTVYRLIAKGTVEETILALHAQKRALVEGLLADSGQAAGMSPKALLELIQQGHGAFSGTEEDTPSKIRHALVGHVNV
jgi:SNF2 family DNA or RNA helicase